MVEPSHEDVLFVVRHMDVQRSEASSELFEVDLSIVVLVKLDKKVDAVLL